MQRPRGFEIVFLGVIVVPLLIDRAYTRAEDEAIDLLRPYKAAAAEPGFRPKPLEIKTVYEVKERFPAVDGPDFLMCDLSIDITNTMPIPVQIAFPPQGVFCGHTVSFAREPDESVPEFAREKRIVEIGARQSVAYKTTGIFTGPPGRYEWVFGKPAEGRIPLNLFIGSVYSDPVSKVEPNREQGNAADSR
jgi:hypothetical protein